MSKINIEKVRTLKLMIMMAVLKRHCLFQIMNIPFHDPKICINCKQPPLWKNDLSTVVPLGL